MGRCIFIHALPAVSPVGVRYTLAKKNRAAEEEKLSKELVSKLWRRSDTGKFTLDLHGKRWTGIRPEWCPRYLPVRNLADEGWPLEGRTTTDRKVAEEWVDTGYVRWLLPRDERAGRGTTHNPTVEQACEAYLADLEKTLGSDHNTLVNRNSAIGCHIKPALGEIDLDALSKQQVREFLMNLKVRKFERGKEVMKPALLGTKSHVRATLHAMWHHAYPDEENAPPFAGIRLGDRAESRHRREAARSGNIPEPNKQERAYTESKVLLLLAEAARHDREVTSQPHLAALYIPNHAAGIAFIYGIGARIEEATFIRWRHIFDHTIYIPGTKSNNAPRYVPRQVTLEPWLAVLRDLAGGDPDPDDFVLRLRRHRGANIPPSDKTWAGRIARMETLAGLKVSGKSAHILRATHLSHARPKLPAAALKAYAGHAQPFGGATDAYVDGRPPFIPRPHQRYLRLPTPAQVEEQMRRLPSRIKADRSK